MTKEQFEQIKYLMSQLELRNKTLEEVLFELEEMFPEFTAPKFRKIYACRLKNFGVYEPIDTNLFQLVSDDEGFYVMAEKAIHFFLKNGVTGRNELPIKNTKAQAIQKFLKGGGE